MAEFKTNVMRILEKNKISFKTHEYPHKDGVCVDGVSVAELLGQKPECVFKTLVTKGGSGSYYVFCVPVAEELDMKKGAKAVGEKSIEMIPVAQILQVTGYVRGGCSPVGMKKQFKTVFHSGVNDIESMMVSAGKIGYQIELAPKDLIALARGSVADIIK